MEIMFKGKEGIALVLAMFFVLVISILLVAILLLNVQEMNATQFQLDNNKAFYYAEGGVEYGLAQILNGKTLTELNSLSRDIRDSFKDNNINYLNLEVEQSDLTDYKITCEVGYNKARRKVTKEISLLDTSFWDNAMASGRDININNATIDISGKISANETVKLGNKVTIVNSLSYQNKANLSFPSELFDFYKNSNLFATYNNEDEFLSNLDKIPAGSVVLIEDNLHLNNLNFKLLKSITILVEGDLTHDNNASVDIEPGANSMVLFIAKGTLHINYVNFTASNTIFFVENANNEKDAIQLNNISFKLTNGGIYGKGGDIDIVNTNLPYYFNLDRGKWNVSDILDSSFIYKLKNWRDTD
jgi:Tfp pilus assembly protein PilX